MWVIEREAGIQDNRFGEGIQKALHIMYNVPLKSGQSWANQDKWWWLEMWVRHEVIRLFSDQQEVKSRLQVIILITLIYSCTLAPNIDIFSKSCMCSKRMRVNWREVNKEQTHRWKTADNVKLQRLKRFWWRIVASFLLTFWLQNRCAF